MLICMRTTMDLDDALLQKAKDLALKEHKPLREIIEQALREKFLRYPAPEELEPITLTVSEKTGGVAGGIDLDNSADLYDIMEKNNGPV